MREKFQELNQQLAELSETINKFESEAVQLRIVELIFAQARQSSQFAEGEAQSYEAGPGRNGKAANGVGGRRAAGERSRRREGAQPSASGAVVALANLVDGDFFEQKRTIGDVVKKCEEEFGIRYKSNAFSGPLSRYARKKDGLKREKNAEGNYVYFK